jgi:hypothetical protein
VSLVVDVTERAEDMNAEHVEALARVLFEVFYPHEHRGRAFESLSWNQQQQLRAQAAKVIAGLAARVTSNGEAVLRGHGTRRTGGS